MSIIDIAIDFAEGLLSGGIPGPTTLEGQRRARLVIGALALIFALSAWALPTTTVTVTAVILIIGSLCAGGWVFVFSIVDVAKEQRAVRPSIAAAVVSAAALGLAVHAVGRVVAGGA